MNQLPRKITALLLSVAILSAYGSPIYAADRQVVTDTQSFSGDFSGATSTQAGGAFYIEATGNASFTDASFSGNSTNVKNGHGGAVYNEGTASFGQGTTFNNNATLGSSSKGGAIYHNKGALTLSGDNTFSGNEAKSSGGAIYSNSNISVGDNSVFSGNSSSTGGALYLNKTEKTIIGKNVSFTDNKVTSTGIGASGGAIYATGSNVTIGDDASFSGNTIAGGNGGAIYMYAARNATGNLTIGNNAKFSSNTANAKHGGALYIYGGTNSKMNTSIGANALFDGNTAIKGMGGAIYNTGTSSLTIADGATFSNNTALQGGAILQNADSELSLNQASFSNNQATGDALASGGGAIFISAGDTHAVNITNSSFNNNTADVAGGAVGQSNGSKAAITVSGSTFSGNEAGAEGGAIVSDSTLTVTDSTFENNKTTGTQIGTSYVDTNEGGGAIFLYDESNTTVSNSTFSGNTSGTFGGAIGMRSGASSEKASLTVENSAFEKNSSGNKGGAINATVNSRISGSSFTGNTAGTHGGAIYNIAELTLSGDNTFSGNEAKSAGGAIYNEGILTASGSFDGNKALNGGAIYNKNELTVADSASFTNNFANITGSAISNYGSKLTVGNDVVFKDNASFLDGYSYDYFSEMGAVYTEGTADRINEVTIGDNVLFEGNKASGGAGLYIYGGNKVTVGNNAQFISNKAQASLTDETPTSSGAAIKLVSSGSNGVPSLTIGDNAKFEGNSALYGGAIDVNSKDAVLTIGKNAQFSANTTTGNIGGAIYNNGTSSIGENAVFDANTAAAGGAIANDNKLTIANNAVFTNNTAVDKGGAVYNRGELTLSGDNTFSGNTDSTGANDIYNSGTVNVQSGTTVLEGGVSGTGTFNVASGATVDIGLGTLQNGTLNFANGSTLGVTLSNDGMGSLKADTITVGESASDTANLQITLSRDFLTDEAGTDRSLTNGTAVTNGSFALADTGNALYNMQLSEDNTLAVTRKSQEEQAAIIANAGGNANNTSVIDAFTSSSDLGSDAANQTADLLNQLAQTDVKAAVEATTALAPEEASAKQVVHASAVRQLFSAIAGRMDAISSSTPRAYALGQDEASYVNGENYSVWLQGLVNKSHKEQTSGASAFTGRSTGLAAGADTKLGEEWLLGLGYAYLHTNVDSFNRHDRILGDNFFLYGQYRPGDFFVQASLNYGDSKYEEDKYVSGLTVDADYHVKSYSADITAGYDINEWLTPLLGVRYMNLQQEGYKDSSDQAVSAAKDDYLTGILGARVQTDYRLGALNLKPQISAGITYDFISDNTQSSVVLPNGTGYDINGERLHRLAFEAGAGVTALVSDSVEILLGYNGNFRQDYNAHTGTLKLRYRF